MLLVSLRQLLKEKLDFNSSRSPVQKGQHPLGHSADSSTPVWVLALSVTCWLCDLGQLLSSPQAQFLHL